MKGAIAGFAAIAAVSAQVSVVIDWHATQVERRATPACRKAFRYRYNNAHVGTKY